MNVVFALFSNGTFNVSDDKGNSFGWTIAGLPHGTVSTSLVSNSTEAIQSYSVLSASSLSVANMSITYRLEYQSCQPSGVEISILILRTLLESLCGGLL